MSDIKIIDNNDTFCVFDVLTKLTGDKESAFFPYHAGFVYNKVSQQTEDTNEFAKFKGDENAQCPMTDLVWHKNRLNLSMRAVINGSIILKEKDGVTANDVGLSDTYPVFVYRSYTFIKDGVTNINKFFVSTSIETKQYFEEKGIVVDDSTDSDGAYCLDISDIPVINREILEGDTSANNFCALIKRDTEISGEIKVLKYYLKADFENTSSQTPQTMTIKQKEYLLANGVDTDKGGVYAPKVEYAESMITEPVKTFDIKIKGLSSIPSVKKVTDKISSGKKRTLSESVVEVGITRYDEFKTDNDDDESRKFWLSSAMSKLKEEQKGIRDSIQRTKFAIILGQKWFDELDTRDDDTTMYDDWKFTFVLGDENVKR